MQEEFGLLNKMFVDAKLYSTAKIESIENIKGNDQQMFQPEHHRSIFDNSMRRFPRYSIPSGSTGQISMVSPPIYRHKCGTVPPPRHSLSTKPAVGVHGYEGPPGACFVAVKNISAIISL